MLIVVLLESRQTLLIITQGCTCKAVKAAACYKEVGQGLIPAARTSRDSLVTALGAGNKYPEAQGLNLGKTLFFFRKSCRTGVLVTLGFFRFSEVVVVFYLSRGKDQLGKKP